MSLVICEGVCVANRLEASGELNNGGRGSLIASGFFGSIAQNTHYTHSYSRIAAFHHQARRNPCERLIACAQGRDARNGNSADGPCRCRDSLS